MPELIPPTSSLHDSWLDARDDWGRGVHQAGSGLHPEDDVDSPDGFEAWVRRLLREADPAVPAGPGRLLVTCDADNAGSARTIEKNGGELEDIRETELGLTRRYWIGL